MSNLLYPSKNKLQERSNLHYCCGITPKHVTSGGAHLCASAAQFRIPKKKRRNGDEPPTPIAMSLTTALRGWYKASVNLNFRMFCALSSKLRKTHGLQLLYHKITAKIRFCGKSVMMGKLHQTLVQTAH